IQRPRGRGAENATTDAERAFGLRLPAHERELLRLSREIDAIRERHNSSWRGGSPQREHSVAHSDVLRRARLLIGSGIKNHRAEQNGEVMTGTHQGYKFLSRSARTNLPWDAGCAPNLSVGIDRFFFYLHNLNACRTFRNGGIRADCPRTARAKKSRPAWRR